MLIVTGRLKSLIMQFHTNIQKTANPCVSDVFWKWSKGNFDEEVEKKALNENGLQQ